MRFVGWAEWVDCRCFLSFVFLGDARRLELSPCNNTVSCMGCLRVLAVHLVNLLKAIIFLLLCGTWRVAV